MQIQPLRKNDNLNDYFNKINELVEAFNNHYHDVSEVGGITLTPKRKRNLSDLAKEQPPRGE